MHSKKQLVFLVRVHCSPIMHCAKNIKTLLSFQQLKKVKQSLNLKASPVPMSQSDWCLSSCVMCPAGAQTVAYILYTIGTWYGIGTQQWFIIHAVLAGGEMGVWGWRGGKFCHDTGTLIGGLHRNLMLGLFSIDSEHIQQLTGAGHFFFFQIYISWQCLPVEESPDPVGEWRGLKRHMHQPHEEIRKRLFSRTDELRSRRELKVATLLSSQTHARVLEKAIFY